MEHITKVYSNCLLILPRLLQYKGRGWIQCNINITMCILFAVLYSWTIKNIPTAIELCSDTVIIIIIIICAVLR